MNHTSGLISNTTTVCYLKERPKTAVKMNLGFNSKRLFLLITESNSYSLVSPLSFQFTLFPIDHSTLAEQYFGWEGFIKHGGGDGINAELVSVGLPLLIGNAKPKII